MSRIRVFLWLAIAAAFCAKIPLASAEEPDVVVVDELQIGFAGAYKVGHWTPLAVTLRSSHQEVVRGDVTVQLDDGDGISTTVRQRDVVLAPGEESMVRAIVKPGRPKAPIDVAFASDGDTTARTFAQ